MGAYSHYCIDKAAVMNSVYELGEVQKEGDSDKVKCLAKLPPVVWRHMDIYGKFEFNQKLLIA